MEGTWSIRDLQPIIVSHKTFFIPIQETGENIENTFLHIFHEFHSLMYSTLKAKQVFVGEADDSFGE